MARFDHFADHRARQHRVELDDPAVLALELGRVAHAQALPGIEREVDGAQQELAGPGLGHRHLDDAEVVHPGLAPGIALEVDFPVHRHGPPPRHARRLLYCWWPRCPVKQGEKAAMHPHDRDRTALLVIDMQNGFCNPGGSIAAMGKDIWELYAIVPKSLLTA